MMSNKLFFLYKGENSVNKYLLSLLLLLPIAFISADEEADNSEEEVEEIVVTGIKKSLLDAIDIKRSKVGISEALSAEDIGKFPDENLAEALGRVSGVSIIRSNVEGQQIIVRGLGPEFNLVTLNGRQMPTAPWLYESGRSFNWGDISAHGIAAIEIFKSSDSSLPTGGIGSTINMITTKPLNIDKDQVGSFSYNYVHDTTSELDNDLESEVDFSFARKGDWVFGDFTNQFGFSVTGSYQHRTNREVGMRESNYKNASGGDFFNFNPNITGGSQRADGNVFLGEPVARQFKDNDRLRENLQTTFQTTIGNDMVLTVDNTLSILDISTQGQMFGSWYGGWDTTDAVIAADGSVLEARVPNRRYDHQVIFGETKSTNKSLGANLEWDVTDNLVLTFDTHESSALIDGAQVQNEIGLTPSGNPQAVMLANWYSDMPSWDYDNGAVFTADAFTYTNGYAREGYKRNDLSQHQINGELTLNMGPLTSIEFGVSSLNQVFLQQQAEEVVQADSSLAATNVDASLLTLTSTSGLTDQLTGTDPGYYFNMNPLAIEADFVSKYGWSAGPVDYDEGVEEQLDQAFIQFNFDTDINGMPLSVVLGVRYEEAETTSTSNITRPAFVAAANTLVYTMQEGNSVETGTSDAVLPTLQASLGITETEVVRFSYSETISRPHLADLSAGRTYSSSDFQQARADGGNPALQPYRATNLDLAYENYYKEGSYYAINLFHKDLTDFIGRETAQDVVLFDDLFNPATRTDAEFQQAMDWAINLIENNWGQYPLFSDPANGVACTSAFAAEDPDCPVAIDGYWSGVNGQDTYMTAMWYIWNAGGGQSWSYDAFDRQVMYYYYAKRYLDYLATGTYNPMGCFGGDWICDNGLLMTDGATGGSGAQPVSFYEVGRPANNLEGSVKGVEVALQHLFDNGYGVQFNYIKTEGDNIEADRYALTEQFYIPGLADSGNFSVFYEDSKMTARLGVNYSAERPSGAANYLQPIFVEARTHVDANFSYNLDMGGTVSLDILNVTDEPTRLYARNTNMSFLAQDHGVVYKLGYRFTF
jgi:TonB-dependent receptor